MLGVEHHVGVHQRRGVRARGLALEHVEKIGGMAEIGARRHRVPVLPEVVMRGDDHRHLRGEADPLPPGGLEGVVPRLRVVRGEGGYRGAEHVHGMRIAYRPDDVVDGGGEAPGLLQRRVEGGELGRGRELAVQQEVGGLLEGRAGREIVDRVSAIPELAGSAIDEGRGGTVEAEVLETAMNLGLIGTRHEPLSSPV